MRWPTAKLGKVAPSKPLKAPSNLDELDVWQLNLDMIESQSGRVLGKLKAPPSQAGSSTHWFTDKHVLYSKLRPYLNKVVLPDEQGIATTELVPMLPDPEKLERRYLAHYLRSEKFVNWVTEQVAGAKMPRVSMKVFWDHEIPLPPLEEQKRIAAILDKADEIRSKRQEAIELADEFLRSVFLDMFGDPVTNPKEWQLKPLKEIAKVTTGNTPSRKEEKFYGNHVEWIKSDNINTPSHFLTLASEYLSEEGAKAGRIVPKGSTLVTCIAGSFDCIGNAAYADRDVAFNQQINALTPKKGVSSWFLYALILFSKKNIQASSTNSMKGMVSKGKMEEILMISPPESKQIEFEKSFLSYLKLISDMVISLNDSNELLSSLCQKAFRGIL
ncbi:restriction endonuclease subunit S [Vibrio campbellii]|nr:restriction endonuclease subunit S [Vibrio campbellii]